VRGFRPCTRCLIIAFFFYFLQVTSIATVGLGKINDGTGMVTFPVAYRAIVFRPFKGEVVDAVVTQVNKMGFMAEVGPLQVFVSKHVRGRCAASSSSSSSSPST
jgi:DNA-directed RNA polymerase II subunit RPB7